MKVKLLLFIAILISLCFLLKGSSSPKEAVTTIDPSGNKADTTKNGVYLHKNPDGTVRKIVTNNPK